jgi:hypothetical protein
MVHYFHLVLAAVLFASLAADVFLVRSPASEALAPAELVAKWRKILGLTEMFVFIAVFALGLTLWLPLIKAYPPAIFHTKFSLAIVFLVLAKVRMLRERKKGVQILLTRIMGIVVFALFLLGAFGGLSA